MPFKTCLYFRRKSRLFIFYNHRIVANRGPEETSRESTKKNYMYLERKQNFAYLRVNILTTTMAYKAS